MSVYQPPGTKVYWYDFRFNGERVRESSKSKVKKIALAAERTHRRRLEEGYNGIQKPKPPQTFAAAAAESIDVCRPKLAASTLSGMERDVEYLRPFIGKKLLPDITLQDIHNIEQARLAAGAANRYVNMVIETLRRVLRRNGEWERLRKDYKKLKEPKRVGMALSPKEEEILLHECQQTTSRVLYPVVALALYTGMRRDEIRSLQWHHIDLEKAFVRVGKSKTAYGENRTIPLIGLAFESMEDWAACFPNRLPSHYVFPAERYASEVGKVYRHNPNKPMGSWRKAWEQARKRAGIRLRFHDLRHTTVTRLLAAGRTIEQIAPIMGWSGQTMHEMSIIYAEWSLDAKRETMSVLAVPKGSDKKKEAKGRESDNQVDGE